MRFIFSVVFFLFFASFFLSANDAKIGDFKGYTKLSESPYSFSLKSSIGEATNFSSKKSKELNPVFLRNAGIGIFIASMISFTIAISADIGAIILGEEEVLFRNDDYDPALVRHVRMALWAILAGFGVMWLILFIPGIILMARGAYLLRKQKKNKKLSFQQGLINNSGRMEISAALSLKF